MDHQVPPPGRSPRLLGLAFLALLLLPLLDLLVGVDPSPPLIEKRVLAPCPALPCDGASWRAFPARFQEYFDDHFGMRASLLRASALLRAFVLEGTAGRSARFGEEGWLYLATDEVNPEWARPLSPDEVAAWGQHLADRQRWLEERGMASLVFFAPDKRTIYPEYLPEGIRPPPGPSRLDQVHAELRRRGDVEFLDLRPALLAEKARRRVYHRTDSHWNQVGAVVSSEAVLGWIAARFPAVQVPPLAAHTFTTVTEGGQDLAQLLGLETLYQEEVFETAAVGATEARSVPVPPEYLRPSELRFAEILQVSEVARDDLPRMVMVRDSFASTLIPHLERQFRRAVYYWSPTFDPGLIRAENPDLVVAEMVERSLLQPVIRDPIELAGSRPAEERAARRPVASWVAGAPPGGLGLQGFQVVSNLPGEGLQLARPLAGPVLVLPPAPGALPEPDRLRVALRVTRDTTGVFQFLERGTGALCAPQRSWKVSLLQGENELWVPVPAWAHGGGARFYPGGGTEPVTLLRVEAYAP